MAFRVDCWADDDAGEKDVAHAPRGRAAVADRGRDVSAVVPRLVVYLCCGLELSEAFPPSSLRPLLYGSLLVGVLSRTKP